MAFAALLAIWAGLSRWFGAPEAAVETPDPPRARTAVAGRSQTRPAVTASHAGDLRAIEKSGMQKHKKLRSGSLEFLYGAHSSTSGDSIKLRIQLPDRRWLTGSDSVVAGIYYYPVRFVYPDDFEGEALQKGTYHVSWLEITKRTVYPNPLSPFAITTVYGNQPHDVYDERVVASEEFVL